MGLEHEYTVPTQQATKALDAEAITPSVTLEASVAPAEKWDASSRERWRQRHPELGPLAIAFDGNRLLTRVK